MRAPITGHKLCRTFQCTCFARGIELERKTLRKMWLRTEGFAVGVRVYRMCWDCGASYATGWDTAVTVYKKDSFDFIAYSDYFSSWQIFKQLCDNSRLFSCLVKSIRKNHGLAAANIKSCPGSSPNKIIAWLFLTRIVTGPGLFFAGQKKLTRRSLTIKQSSFRIPTIYNNILDKIHATFP